MVEHGAACQTGAAGVDHLHWSLISNTEFSFEMQLWNCASVILCRLIPCVTAADNDGLSFLLLAVKMTFLSALTSLHGVHVCLGVCARVCACADAHVWLVAT